jgi:LPS-assembly lipoprotein
MYKVILAILFSSLVTGCGFHMAGKGTYSSELSNTHIQGPASSRELLLLLEKRLRSNQINVVEDDTATAIIRILDEVRDKTTLSVDTQGKAREYELFLQVTYEVKRPDNTTLLPQETIDINRDFVFNKADLLGTNEEENELYNEMRNDAAKLIVYKLQAI